MKKLGRNSSGITLIALVVTVILVIIIAGISIWSLMGDKNIINQAFNARNSTAERDAEAEVNEQWLLVQNEYKFSYLTNEELAQKLQERLVKKGGSATVTYKSSANVFDVSYKGGNYIVNTTGSTATGRLASDVLKTNASATTPEEKSPYVQFAGNSTKYRVLYDATSPYGIEVISDKNVGEAVTLGSGDTRSTETDAKEKAKWSYTNAIETLNLAAEQRANISSNLVSQVRCVGSRPSNKNFKITDKYSSTLTPNTNSSYFPENYNGLWERGEGVYGESDGGWVISNQHNYTDDWNRMETLSIRTTGEAYWLASRSVGAYTSNIGFRVRYVTAEGGSNDNSLFNVRSSGIGSSAPWHGVRPVCRLASTATVTGGSGTESDPYILGK